MPSACRAAVVVLAALSLPLSTASGKTLEVKVAYVLSGDTAVLDDGTTVHYVGIVAPAHGGKSDESFGQECFELNKKLVAGKLVRLETDSKERDESGALLAYVYVGRFFINASLVQSGYARVAVRSPNTRYAALFEQLQAEAKQQKRGLWKLPQPVAPTFSNKDLQAAAGASGKPAAPPKNAKVFENKDLEPYDIPGEEEAPPPAEEAKEGAGESTAPAKEAVGKDKEAAPPASTDASAGAPAIPPEKGK